MRKLLICIILFPLFFTVFSEALAVRKTEIFNEWATNFLIEKTGSPEGEIPEIDLGETFEDRFLKEVPAASGIILVLEVKYIRDTPLRRIPVIITIDFYGKLFTTESAVAYAVVAYAMSSGYWVEKVEELEVMSGLEMAEQTLEDVEDTEYYAEWCQTIRNEIETLDILEDLAYGLETPEQLAEEVLNYSLEEVPFTKRIFLRYWDNQFKKRAQFYYESYQQHLEEDDLVTASVYLLYLGAMRRMQENVLRDLDSHGFNEYSYGTIIILELGGLIFLSAAATALCLMLLFYRKNAAVIAGIPLGFAVAFVPLGYFNLISFCLVGAAAVYLTDRLYKIPLDRKETARISLRAGGVLFLTHYVLNAVLYYAGIMQTEGSGDLGSLAGESPVILGVVTVIQIVVICLLSVGGGLLARKILSGAEKSREE